MRNKVFVDVITHYLTLLGRLFLIEVKISANRRKGKFLKYSNFIWLVEALKA